MVLGRGVMVVVGGGGGIKFSVSEMPFTQFWDVTGNILKNNF